MYSPGPPPATHPTPFSSSSLPVSHSPPHSCFPPVPLFLFIFLPYSSFSFISCLSLSSLFDLFFPHFHFSLAHVSLSPPVLSFLPSLSIPSVPSSLSLSPIFVLYLPFSFLINFPPITFPLYSLFSLPFFTFPNIHFSTDFPQQDIFSLLSPPFQST